MHFSATWYKSYLHLVIVNKSFFVPAVTFKTRPTRKQPEVLVKLLFIFSYQITNKFSMK